MESLLRVGGYDRRTKQETVTEKHFCHGPVFFWLANMTCHMNVLCVFVKSIPCFCSLLCLSVSLMVSLPAPVLCVISACLFLIFSHVYVFKLFVPLQVPTCLLAPSVGLNSWLKPLSILWPFLACSPLPLHQLPTPACSSWRLTCPALPNLPVWRWNKAVIFVCGSAFRSWFM